MPGITTGHLEGLENQLGREDVNIMEIRAMFASN
jgi:hypothetical protein